MKKIILFLSLFVILFCFNDVTYAQKDNVTVGPYHLKKVVDLQTTSVKNQALSGTCWSFSTVSFFESELIRTGKGHINLSPMFVVNHAYQDKAIKYVRMHGHTQFGAGGEAEDVKYVWEHYGIEPLYAYTGLPGGQTKYRELEMDKVLKSMLDAVITNPDGMLDPEWHKAFDGALNGYLGKIPKTFTYKGKTYTPKSFARYLGLNMKNYIPITSFNSHPFYTKYAIEIPDNWEWAKYYNIKLNDMMDIINNAIKHGYSVAWGADVSNPGFNFKRGLAVVPNYVENWDAMSPAARDTIFTHAYKQMNISQAFRQKMYNNYTTQDDHGMQIIGIYKDQNGDTFYRIKNSWGTKNVDKGYFFASAAYVRLNTTTIMVNKNSIPVDLQKEMGL
ncbi:MAG TPA: C1 family peptidase [Balneolales bacterium]|nr:C1 family peptidase [Balneolales bacterium]